MAHITGNKKHLESTDYADFDPDLDIDVPAGCEVVEKNLPHPTSHSSNRTIKWFNAFGVERNGEYVDVEYTVTMQKLPDGKQLFYLGKNGKPEQILDTQTSDAGNNDKGKRMIRFKLSIGDPPIGAFP